MRELQPYQSYKHTPEIGPVHIEHEPERQYVHAIYISPALGAPMQPVDSVMAIAGVGLENDRYANRKGSWSTKKNAQKPPRIPDSDRQVTLIALDQIAMGNILLAQMGARPITEAQTRRNIIVTLSSDQLNALVDNQFAVGNTIMEGVELCEPCSRPPTLLGRAKDGKAFEKAFEHMGGIRARIVRGGTISIHDRVFQILPHRD